MVAERAFSTIDDLIAHLETLAETGSDEGLAMSELDHGLQTAAILRDTDPDDLELQIAGLVHDLAHPWDGPGQPEHHRMGARAVRGLLGNRVAFLVEGHVDAKRYLVATDVGYRAALSPGSLVTLTAQGGPMTPGEVVAAEASADWAAAVALRRADDGAKVVGAVVPGLDAWVPALRTVGRH
jgi:predicted HD phosphohydrolase